MRIWLYASAGACLWLGTLGVSAAQAAPMSVDRLGGVQDFNLKQDAQYLFGGRRYCFYPNGWRGPGFYWCGYNLRRGLGWGGPSGWRGWNGPRRVERPRIERRMEMQRNQRREMRAGPRGPGRGGEGRGGEGRGGGGRGGGGRGDR